MIALLVGLIVVSATISIYVATVSSSSSTIKSTRLNHDLDAVMTLMVNDIKRAGYWGGARVGADSRNNPFTVVTTTATAVNFAPTNVSVMDFTDDGGTNHVLGCILYSYDADGDRHYDGSDGNDINGDGDYDDPGEVAPDGDYADPGEVAPNGDITDATDDRNEFYGFRFNVGASGLGIIEMRKTGTTTTDCTDGEWDEFIDGTQLTIDTLQFSFTKVDVNGDGDVMDGIDLPATSRCLNVTKEGKSTDTTRTVCTPRSPPITPPTPPPDKDWADIGDNIVEKRVVNIQLRGNLTSDTTVTKTINGTVEVRNSRASLL